MKVNDEGKVVDGSDIKVEEKEEKNSMTGESGQGEQGESESHYVWMHQRFNSRRSWVWIVNSVVYVAVIATYFCVDGHELIFSMYLPLDALLNLAKAIFYFACQWKDQREIAKQMEMAEILKTKFESKVKDKIEDLMKVRKNTVKSDKDGNDGTLGDEQVVQ